MGLCSHRRFNHDALSHITTLRLFHHVLSSPSHCMRLLTSPLFASQPVHRNYLYDHFSPVYPKLRHLRWVRIPLSVSKLKTLASALTCLLSVPWIRFSRSMSKRQDRVNVNVHIWRLSLTGGLLHVTNTQENARYLLHCCFTVTRAPSPSPYNFWPSIVQKKKLKVVDLKYPPIALFTKWFHLCRAFSISSLLPRCPLLLNWNLDFSGFKYCFPPSSAYPHRLRAFPVCKCFLSTNIKVSRCKDFVCEEWYCWN